MTATVVLPSYNEVETVPSLISQLVEYETVAEVVLVDDDSPDGTAEAAQDRFGDRDDVQIIRRTGESGLSSAVVRGFDTADAETLVCMDADGQHPVGSAISCARVCDDGVDMVVGSRHTETGQVADDWPLHRQAISYGAQALAYAAVPQARKLTDPMSGLFAIDASIYGVARPRLEPTGYKIGLELLAKAPVDDVVELGYTFQKRDHGASNLGIPEYLRYVEHLSCLVIPSRRSGRPSVEVSPDVE